MITDQVMHNPQDVQKNWRKTQFLDTVHMGDSRKWLLATMRCIDRIGSKRFSLQDLYGFESELHSLFPENRHIREKLRQQLQILRDQGYLQFKSRGHYIVL